MSKLKNSTTFFHKLAVSLISILPIFCTMPAMCQDRDTKTVALIEPIVKGGKVSETQKSIVRARLASVATAHLGYTALTRIPDNVKVIMDLHKFEQGGNVPASTWSEVGQMMGAQYICIAQISADSSFHVSYDLIGVESGAYLNSVDDIVGKTDEEILRNCEILAIKLFNPKRESKGTDTKDSQDTKDTKETDTILDPAKAKKHYEKGVLSRGKKFWDLAELEFTEAIKLNPKNTDAYIERGKTYFEKAKTISEYEDEYEDKCRTLYTQAIADFTEAIKLDPRNAGAYIERGKIYVELISTVERTDEYKAKEFAFNTQAIADFTEVIKLDPKNVDAYIERGRVYFDIAEPFPYEASENDLKLKKTISDFSQAIQLDPKNADAYVERSCAYAWFDNKRSMADLAQAIKRDPKNADKYYVQRGFINRNSYDIDSDDDPQYAIRDRRQDVAIEDFSRAISINPKNAEAYFMRAKTQSGKRKNSRFYGYKEQSESIIEEFNKVNATKVFNDILQAYKLDPRSYAEEMANQYKENGACDKAIEILDQAIKDNIDDFEIGRILVHRSEYLRNNQHLLYTRGKLHFDCGNYERAINDYTRLINEYSSSALVDYYYLSRGEAYKKKGDMILAESDFAKAKELRDEWDKLKTFSKN